MTIFKFQEINIIDFSCWVIKIFREIEVTVIHFSYVFLGKLAVHDINFPEIIPHR